MLGVEDDVLAAGSRAFSAHAVGLSHRAASMGARGVLLLVEDLETLPDGGLALMDHDCPAIMAMLLQRTDGELIAKEVMGFGGIVTVEVRKGFSIESNAYLDIFIQLHEEVASTRESGFAWG
eukprot:1547712-Amphidinium_carterae.1